MPDDTSKAALVGQLQTTGANSKKFRLVSIGLGCIMFIFVGSAVVIVKKPEIAASFTSLAQIIVTAIGGMVGIYCGAQAWSETSTTNALAK